MALKTPNETGTKPDATPIPSFNLSQSHEIEALATENQLLPANGRVGGRFRDDEFQNLGGVIGCARIEEI